MTASTDSFYRNLNALGLLALVSVLSYAEYAQLIQHELPCPLCLLQRMGFVGVMFGLFLNVIYGSRPLHYSLSVLAAVFGAATALRQISLHVIPGTPGYGAPFMGYHFYTWAFIVFVVIITGLAVVSSFANQYGERKFRGFGDQAALAKIAIVTSLFIVLANALVTFAECGPLVCPDNPTDYWLFQRP